MELLREVKFIVNKQKHKVAFYGEITHTRVRTCERVEIYIDDWLQDCDGKDYWYNRPWYSFKYQNAMRDCVRNNKSVYISRLKNNFMQEHSYKALTKEREKEFKKTIKGDLKIKLFNKLLKMIENSFVKQTRKKADDFFNNFMKDYDSLSDTTKKHLANSGIVLQNKEQAKAVMQISKVFDLLLK